MVQDDLNFLDAVLTKDLLMPSRKATLRKAQAARAPRNQVSSDFHARCINLIHIGTKKTVQWPRIIRVSKKIHVNHAPEKQLILNMSYDNRELPC